MKYYQKNCVRGEALLHLWLWGSVAILTIGFNNHNYPLGFVGVGLLVAFLALCISGKIGVVD